MQVYTTAPMEDARSARQTFPRLESLGYDGAFSFEAKLDPFLPLVLAAEHTDRLRLGTAIAIAFARTPMNVAYLAHGLQAISEGRFLLGLGSQVRPHIENRFAMPWSRPAARMEEFVRALRAGFQTIPEANLLPFGPPPIYTAGFGPKMTRVAGVVADGFLAHPFSSRRSLLERTLPALEAGLGLAGRRREDLDVICATLEVTGDSEESFRTSREAARAALARITAWPARRVLMAHAPPVLEDGQAFLTRTFAWLRG